MPVRVRPEVLGQPGHVTTRAGDEAIQRHRGRIQHLTHAPPPSNWLPLLGRLVARKLIGASVATVGPDGDHLEPAHVSRQAWVPSSPPASPGRCRAPGATSGRAASSPGRLRPAGRRPRRGRHVQPHPCTAAAPPAAWGQVPDRGQERQLDRFPGDHRHIRLCPARRDRLPQPIRKRLQPRDIGTGGSITLGSGGAAKWCGSTRRARPSRASRHAFVAIRYSQARNGLASLFCIARSILI
jgi:hypothetical protein